MFVIKGFKKDYFLNELNEEFYKSVLEGLNDKKYEDYQNYASLNLLKDIEAKLEFNKYSTTFLVSLKVYSEEASEHSDNSCHYKNILQITNLPKDYKIEEILTYEIYENCLKDAEKELKEFLKWTLEEFINENLIIGEI